MRIEELTNDIRSLIKSNNIADALKLLLGFINDRKSLNEAILHSSNYKSIMESARLGLIGFEEESLMMNRLKKSILEFLIELENEVNNNHEIRSDLQKQNFQPTANNVISNNTFEKIENIVINQAHQIINYNHNIERKYTDVSLVDIGVNNGDYYGKSGYLDLTYYPKFSLQSMLDLTGNTSEKDVPIEFDIKLINKGTRLAYLKEVKIEILDCKMDKTPVFDYFPSIDNGNLVFVLKNYGWGKFNCLNFAPINFYTSELVEPEDYKFFFNGWLKGHSVFIVPKELIALPKEKRIKRERAEAIKQNFQNLWTRNAISNSVLGYLNENDKKLRNEYIDYKSGVSLEDFRGEILFDMPNEYSFYAFDNPRKMEMKWGQKYPNVGYDLIVTEDGFDLITLTKPGAYIPPTFNYNVELSINEKNKILRHSLSHTIEPDKPERFTISVSSKESAYYTLMLHFLYDEHEFVSSEKMKIHIPKYNEFAKLENVFLHNGTNWVKTKI